MSHNEKVPWSNEYKIGISSVDAQHKKLFDLVNALYEINDDNMKEELRNILYAFSDYMEIHFKDEEDYMLSIGYPELEEHKKIHKDIVERLLKLIHTPAKLNVIKSKMRVVAKRVLIDHILHEDMKIKLFLLEKGEDKDIELDIFDLSEL